jgi:hypothetical protein
MRLKIAAATLVAVMIGFAVGWLAQFERLMAEHRPDGCDGPCYILASEYWDDALWGGLLGALAVGLIGLGLAWRYFAKPSY